jgi:hypothetical protein
MAGLVPAIHVFLVRYAVRTWMPGTRPGMTKERSSRLVALPAQPLYIASRSSRSCTRPLKRSSLYPVIGNGLAPAVACRAALAIVPGFAG